MEEPTRIFYSTYMLAPPYQVFRDANNYYQLKKESDHLTVDTSSSFWKVKLYCMRVKTWSVNIVIFLVYSIWLGPVGFRCLFGVVDFEYNTNINYETGALVHSTRHTVIGQFLQVMKGVTDSRNAF